MIIELTKDRGCLGEYNIKVNDEEMFKGSKIDMLKKLDKLVGAWF